MRILLVDDDAFLRDMYATKFTELGHEVVAASTGERAREELASGEFDVLLADVVMPGLTGLQLVSEIKGGKRDGKPVCIILSNQSEEADIEAARTAGAKGYIVKAETVPSEVVEQVIRIVSE